MTKDTTKEAAVAAEVLLFDDWFDAIGDGVRARVRGFIETMLEEELKPEKPAQKRLFRLREQAHVDRALPATQNRAHGYRQNLMKVVQRRIASARVVQTLPAFDKAIQDSLPRRKSAATR